MFIAVFGAAARPERMRFLTMLREVFPEPVRFVAFNTSMTVEADFEVVNAAVGLKPALPDPLETLEELLIEHCPDDVKLLLDHAKGELGFGFRAFDDAIRKHVTMIRAFCEALNHYNPDHVFLWNQFNAQNRTLEAILKRRGVGIGFFHDGVLPGSIAIDFDAEMGESWIAREPERFMSVPVSDEQVARASTFLDGLRGQRNQRHVQVEDISVVEALHAAGLADRPVMFFAGQNDWHAGIKPKSPSRQFHSPLFAGSMEALETLDKVAGDVGISIVFKPHPLSRDRFAFLRAHDFKNTVVLQHTSIDACLDACDVAATIASQACYVAMQADLPVLMLGRNQLTGKGLTYDMDSVDMLSEGIKDALRHPLGATQRENFARHAAQLERACLFDYGTLDGTFYRRGVKEAAQLISQSTKMPTDELIDAIAKGAFA